MFWIYGGSFNSGGNVQYPGHILAMHDVVVVTVNYRLNIFGQNLLFTYHARQLTMEILVKFMTLL